MKRKLDYALDYISKGYAVLILSPNSKIPAKHPLQQNGVLNATQDEVTVRHLWSDMPDGNIGIACGEKSGITVIDLDGAEAKVSMRDLNCKIPDTYVVQTARRNEQGNPDGWHIYTTYDPTVEQSAKRVPHVDIRNNGGYVVGAGSVVDGSEYIVLTDNPVSLFDYPDVFKTQALNGASPTRRVNPTVLNPDTPNWVTDFISNGVGHGQRNSTATRLAGWFHAHKIPQDTTLSILAGFNDKCDPPMDNNELEHVVRSVYRYVIYDDEQEGLTPVEKPIVNISVANRREYLWADTDLIIKMDRITQGKLALECLIEVSRHDEDIYGPVRMNLYSATQRNSLQTQLWKSNKQFNWLAYVNQAAKILKHSLDVSGASFDMRKYNRLPSDESWLVKPFIQNNSNSLIFGMGGEGKSTLVYTLLLSLASGRPLIPGIEVGPPSAVMMCDWEDTPDAFYDTCTAILRGAGMTWSDVPYEVLYRSYAGPLADHVDQIQKDIAEHQVTCIAVDSILASSGQAVEESEAARVWHQVMGELNVASIGITHVAKDARNRSTPYGSVYFWNLARSVFEIARETEDEDNNIIAIHHRKSNRTSLLNPIGLRVTFESDSNNNVVSIEYEEADLTQTETLVAALKPIDRIIALLAEGVSMTPEQISEELDMKNASVRQSLKRALDSKTPTPIIRYQNNQYGVKKEGNI